MTKFLKIATIGILFLNVAGCGRWEALNQGVLQGNGERLTAGSSQSVGTAPTISAASLAAEQDFRARCNAPGVISCQGFDSSIVSSCHPLSYNGSGMYVSSDDNTTCPVLDSTNSRSGASSILFTVPRQAGSEPTGSWRQYFQQALEGTVDTTYTFGPPGTPGTQGNHFYIQYAQKMDRPFITQQYPGGTYWKQQIIARGDVSCGPVELTTVNDYNEGFPLMYSSCGGQILQSTASPGSPTNPLLEQGTDANTGYNCIYGDPPTGNCFYYPVDTWVTYYYDITLNSWGGADSVIKAYVSVNGQPYQQFVNIPNFIQYQDNTNGYNMIYLVPYMTARDSTVAVPEVAHTWYDELIVSTQPIAAPGVPPADGPGAASSPTPPPVTTPTPTPTSTATPVSTPTPNPTLPPAPTPVVPPTGGYALGWTQLPNTAMAPVCPDYATYPSIYGATGCAAVITAWNSGIADTKRNRLVFWGGGHADYAGNEIYALDLMAKKIMRLNNPSDPVGYDVEANPDGKAASRHTYGGLAYIPSIDAMFVHGGNLYGSGTWGASLATWTFDFSSLSWARKDPTGGSSLAGASYQSFSDYDPYTDAVYVADQNGLFLKYDYKTNSFINLQVDNTWGVNDSVTAVIDSDRHQFYLFGSGAGAPTQVMQADISSGGLTTLADITAQVSGCDGIAGANYPGLAYDSNQRVIVGWTGGDTVYLYNPDTKSCTTKTFSGGPGPAAVNGVAGHFRYFPALNVFALVNDWQQNAYVLKLTQ